MRKSKLSGRATPQKAEARGGATNQAKAAAELRMAVRMVKSTIRQWTSRGFNVSAALLSGKQTERQLDCPRCWARFEAASADADRTFILLSPEDRTTVWAICCPRVFDFLLYWPGREKHSDRLCKYIDGHFDIKDWAQLPDKLRPHSDQAQPAG